MDSIVILSLCLIAFLWVGIAEETEPTEDFQRTVIFIEKYTFYGQELFLRGGIDHGQREGCTDDADTSACAIPIKHRIGGTNEQFNAWKVGDDFLDWQGAEPDQSGKYNDDPASGTPMVWTCNDDKSNHTVAEDGFGYTELNEWGEHYWMVDVDMDCSKTEDGWFEVKGLLDGGWESNIDQDGSCEGDAGGDKPYSTGNHMGRCGHLNSFSFNGNDCYISNLE